MVQIIISTLLIRARRSSIVAIFTRRARSTATVFPTARSRAVLTLQSRFLSLLAGWISRRGSWFPVVLGCIVFRGILLRSILPGSPFIAPTTVARTVVAPLAFSTPATTTITPLLCGSIHRPFAYPFGHLALGNIITQERFDAMELALLLLRNKGNGRALGLGPGRTAYAVDVILGVVGHVVVDDKAYLVNIDTP